MSAQTSMAAVRQRYPTVHGVLLGKGEQAVFVREGNTPREESVMAKAMMMMMGILRVQRVSSKGQAALCLEREWSETGNE